jgi:hypothetical protein
MEDWDTNTRKDFEFVFDCGTYSTGPKSENREKHIKTHIDAYDPEDDVVDLLFLSHLDEDHYNGAELLCAERKVSRIILPYFTMEEFCFLIASKIVSSKKTILSTPFVKDLAAIATGTKTTLLNVPVTLVVANPEGDLPRAPDPAPRDPVPRDPVRRGGRLVPCTRDQQGALIPLGSTCLAGESIELADDVSGRADTVWILRPWSYMLNASAVIQMRTAILGCAPLAKLLKLGSNVTDADIAALTKEKKKLREVMRQIIRAAGGSYAGSLAHPNGNSPSLCLYSGIDPARNAICIDRVIPHHFTDSPGWLTTGDALLSSHWKQFEAAYRDVLPSVGTYVVPHHGASRNHCPDLMQAVSCDSTAVICAGHAVPHHPSTTTLSAIDAAGHSLAYVTQYGKLGFQECIHIYEQ